MERVPRVQRRRAFSPPQWNGSYERNDGGAVKERSDETKLAAVERVLEGAQRPRSLLLEGFADGGDESGGGFLAEVFAAVDEEGGGGVDAGVDAFFLLFFNA